jgi:hypothetical protein
MEASVPAAAFALGGMYSGTLAWNENSGILRTTGSLLVQCGLGLVARVTWAGTDRTPSPAELFRS